MDAFMQAWMKAFKLCVECCQLTDDLRSVIAYQLESPGVKYAMLQQYFSERRLAEP